MGSVSDQRYGLQNYNTGEEVSPSGDFLYNPRTDCPSAEKPTARFSGSLSNISACYISLALWSRPPNPRPRQDQDQSVLRPKQDQDF